VTAFWKVPAESRRSFANRSGWQGFLGQRRERRGDRRKFLLCAKIVSRSPLLSPFIYPASCHPERQRRISNLFQNQFI